MVDRCKYAFDYQKALAPVLILMCTFLFVCNANMRSIARMHTAMLMILPMRADLHYIICSSNGISEALRFAIQRCNGTNVHVCLL